MNETNKIKILVEKFILESKTITESDKDAIIAATYSLTSIMKTTEEFKKRREELEREITETIRSQIKWNHVQ